MVYWPTKSGFRTKYLHKNRFGFKFLGFLHLAISLENYANLLCALKNGIFITFVVETKKANLQIFIKRNLESKSPIQAVQAFYVCKYPLFLHQQRQLPKSQSAEKKLHFPFFHLQASLQVSFVRQTEQMHFFKSFKKELQRLKKGECRKIVMG